MWIQVKVSLWNSSRSEVDGYTLTSTVSGSREQMVLTTGFEKEIRFRTKLAQMKFQRRSQYEIRSSAQESRFIVAYIRRVYGLKEKHWINVRYYEEV